jgi:hypothetical protein
MPWAPSSTWPLMGCSRPMISRSSVLLPAPLGPAHSIKQQLKLIRTEATMRIQIQT